MINPYEPPLPSEDEVEEKVSWDGEDWFFFVCSCLEMFLVCFYYGAIGTMVKAYILVYNRIFKGMKWEKAKS